MKKYNKIVGTFKATIAKLEKLNKDCFDQSQFLATRITGLEQQKRDAISEGDMAQTTADKLKEIFG